ncbi:substrate-binding domain-containing protein [Uliginosibacterium paludis]|uniref:Substrate-binding domain-containing protein n=1 Tax=Uliginosibacterium paludis TaxID=1615952 RepID=A0ABV2CVQ1_9RHOO
MRKDPRTLARTLLALCLISGGLPDARAAQPCVGVIPAGSGHAFWREVESGARRAGKTLGVEIYFRGPAEDNTPEAQRAVIDVIEKKGCAALVLAPASPGLNEDVSRLRKRGIPTVHIDRTYEGAEVVAVVATDNFHAGVMAGDRMASLLPAGAAVGLLRLQKGVVSTDAREAGFVEAATRRGLRIIFETELGTRVGEARTRAEETLRHAPTLAGLFAPNESTTSSALAAMRKTGLAGKVRLVGFDINRALLDSVGAGDVDALLVQRPERMGYEGVMRAWSAVSARGAPEAAGRTDTGVFFVDATQLQSATMRESLAPYLASPR